MKCPHCGASMQEEQVFCESCGKERHLVPIFDAEVYQTMETAISGIVGDLANTQEIVPLFDEQNPEPARELIKEKEEFDNEFEEQLNSPWSRGGFRISPLVFALGGIAVVLILVLTIVTTFQIKNVRSYDFQIKKAEEMCAIGDYNQMLDYAENALALAPNSSDARMLMARAYAGMNMIESEKGMLEELLALDRAYLPAYDLLIALYDAYEMYPEIAQLLANCDIQSVKDTYVEYLASPPLMSEKSGAYDEAIALKLIAPGTGEIYYTLDGSKPQSSSNRYITPIFLTSGHYEINAVYVNNFGIESDLMQASFYIKETAMSVPVVSLTPGVYTEPQYITVSVEDETHQVYYTTDGTEPGIESTLYEGPIPLPLGESHFAFVMIDEEGIPGEITYTDYKLDMEITLTGEQASNLLMQALISAGYILDADGHIRDVEGVRQYHTNTVITVNEQYFYLLDEIFISSDGTLQKTGNAYAVNVMTGESYQAFRNAEGMFNLRKLQ